MQWRTFGPMLLTELRLYAREPLYASLTLLFPVLFFAFFAGIMGNRDIDGQNYFAVYIPATVGMVIFINAFFSIGVQFAADKEQGIIRRYRVTPLRPSTLLAVTIVKGMVLVIIAAVEIMLVGWLGFHAPITNHVLPLLGAVLLSTIMFFAMGFVLGGWSPSLKVALGVAMVLMYPMMFLSGSTMPLSQLPKAFQTTSKGVPLMWVNQAIQQAWIGAPLTDCWVSIAVLSALTVACCGLAVKTLRWE